MAFSLRTPAATAPLVLAASLAAAGCHSSDAATTGMGGGDGPPAMPARTVHLAEKILSDFDEYLASLTSRHSITLYPQVSGYIRAIQVKPGQTVQNGAVLIAIDPGQQAATLRALDASLQTKKANLAYAVQNDESSRELVAAGVLGQLDYQQRRSQRLSAEAEVKAAQEQLQAQSDLLRFYTIVAPSDGVVGDVPVKVGDYVNPQSRLTSVDQDKLIEAYVYIPITKANAIKPETSIQLVGDDGRVVCEEKPSFIAPQVSVDTQTVLVKTVCPNADNLRAGSVLRVRGRPRRQRRRRAPAAHRGRLDPGQRLRGHEGPGGGRRDRGLQRAEAPRGFADRAARRPAADRERVPERGASLLLRALTPDGTCSSSSSSSARSSPPSARSSPCWPARSASRPCPSPSIRRSRCRR
jgi:RND family efflux transporter MFP subunit